MMPLIGPTVPLAVLMEFVSDVSGMLLVITGAVAGCFRTWAVLIEIPADRLEWITALGFAAGAISAILIVFIDFALGLG